jgi:hypothetical protein
MEEATKEGTAVKSAEKMKIIKIPDETFQFLAWLVRQDITLPNVMVYYLKWNRYAWKEIKAHLDILNEACIESAEEK